MLQEDAQWHERIPLIPDLQAAYSAWPLTAVVLLEDLYMLPSRPFHFKIQPWSWPGFRNFKSFLRRSKRTSVPIMLEPAESNSMDSPADSPGIDGGPSVAPSPRPVLDLTDQIKITHSHAAAHGGFADIYQGVWTNRTPDSTDTESEKTIQVAVKLLRVFTRQDVDSGRLQKRLNREVHVWRRLDHLNIAKFYGVFQFGGRPALVTQWYSNGTAPSYLASRSAECRLELVKDVCRGLKYLHTLLPPIVHGDLKGNNVLVDDNGHAVLSDFGLSQVIEELTTPTGNTTIMVAGSMRWQAPELLFDEDLEGDDPPRPSSASDVWSFGCTAYELLTGRLPYGHHVYEWKVIQDLMKRVTPICRDDDIILKSRGLPELLKSCWDWDPFSRPNISAVEKELHRIQLRVAG